MNFLAHLWLSDHTPAGLTGALLGDFLKGPIPDDLPAALAAGVRLHRTIDNFADRHPLARRAAARLDPTFGRYRPVLIDLFFDHFLAVDWHRFEATSLPLYAQNIYRQLDSQQQHMPGLMRQVVEAMRRGDWLSRYATVEGIGGILERMAVRRAKRPNPLAAGVWQLDIHRDALRGDFHAFFPHVVQLASQHPGGRGFRHLHQRWVVG